MPSKTYQDLGVSHKLIRFKEIRRICGSSLAQLSVVLDCPHASDMPKPHPFQESLPSCWVLQYPVRTSRSNRYSTCIVQFLLIPERTQQSEGCIVLALTDRVSKSVPFGSSESPQRKGLQNPWYAAEIEGSAGTVEKSFAPMCSIRTPCRLNMETIPRVAPGSSFCDAATFFSCPKYLRQLLGSAKF